MHDKVCICSHIHKGLFLKHTSLETIDYHSDEPFKWTLARQNGDGVYRSVFGDVIILAGKCVFDGTYSAYMLTKPKDTAETFVVPAPASVPAWMGLNPVERPATPTGTVQESFFHSDMSEEDVREFMLFAFPSEHEFEKFVAKRFPWVMQHFEFGQNCGFYKCCRILFDNIKLQHIASQLRYHVAYM